MNPMSLMIRSRIWLIGMLTLALSAALVVAMPHPAEAQSASTTPEAPVNSAVDESSASYHARRQNHPVQVTGKTTQTQTLQAEPNGSFSLNVTASPTRVQASNGSWKDIDSTLVKSGAVYTPKTSGNDVRVGASTAANSMLASVTVPASVLPQLAAAQKSSSAAAAVQVGWRPGQKRTTSDPSVALLWPTAHASPAVSGNQAIFRNLTNGIDAVIDVTGQTFTPQFIVRKRTNKSVTIRMPLKLHKLKLQARSDGGFSLIDTSGRTVSVNGAAVAHDAETSDVAGNNATSTVVSYKVQGSSLYATIPAKFMKDKRTTFPVTLTGGSEILASTATTYTTTKEPTTVHDTTSSLLAGRSSGEEITRTYLNFNVSHLADKAVVGSQLFVYQKEGTNCSGPKFQVLAPKESWAQSLTWNQAAKFSYNSADIKFNPKNGHPPQCGGGYIGGGPPKGGIIVTKYAQAWAAGTIPKNGFMINVVNEKKSKYVATLNSGRAPTKGPALWVNYFNMPATPSNPKITPFSGGQTNTLNPKLSATVHQSDPQLKGPQALFQVFEGTKMLWQGVSAGAFPGTDGFVYVPNGILKDGHTYYFRSYGYDFGYKSSGYVQSPNFTVDTVAPLTPNVSASKVNNNQWLNPLPSDNLFTFTADPGDKDVVSFQVEQDGVIQTQNVAVGTGGKATVAWAPQTGWHVLRVWSVDKAGNRSKNPVTFSFGAGPTAFTSGVTARSTKFFPVAASTDGVASGATISWRSAGETDFHPIPNQYLIVNGQAWDGKVIQTGPGSSLPTGMRWNADMKDQTPRPVAPSIINLRVCFRIGTADQCSDSNQTSLQLVNHAFGGTFATASVAGGQLALSTGELSLPATDASVPGSDLTAGRTWLSNTADTSDTDSIFGPGWQAVEPTSSGGALGANVIDQSAQGVLMLNYPNGATDVYARNGGGTGVGTYVGQGLTVSNGSRLTLTSTNLALQDASGTLSTWTKTGNTWKPSLVTEPLNQGKTKVDSDATANNVGTYRNAVTGEYQVSPGNAGWCADLPLATAKTKAGCQILEMAITPKSAQANDGNYPGRVSSMTMTLWDPQASTPGMKSTVVARYSYNDDGLLTTAWDPELDGPNGSLMSHYDYDIDGTTVKLKSATPSSATVDGSPYLKPFTLTYDDELDRLVTVTRETPDGDDATTKIVYGVGMSGDGLPDLTPDATQTWNQSISNAPVAAVAVFPPGEDVPNVDVGDPAPGDWQFANITYMNGIGAVTNTADYGAGQWLVGTTTYTRDGYPNASLSPENRQLALDVNPAQCTAPTAVCTQGSSSARALLLASITSYNDPNLPGVATDTLTPSFDAVVQSLKTSTDPGIRTVRTHVKTTYNEGAPTGDQYAGMALATTIMTGAKVMDGTDNPDRDVRTATNGYGTPIGGTSGWILRQPTSASQNGVTTLTAYNADGTPSQVRQPLSNGSDAGTTLMSYYSASGNAGCQDQTAHPEWDGLVCKSGPAAQPSGASMPTSYTTAYSMRLQPVTVMDKSGGVTRVSSTTYDSASGRTTSTLMRSDQSGDQPIPTKTITYNPNIDAVASTSAAGQTVSTSYDAWGRSIDYTDGSSTTSHASYNLAGQLSTMSDGKGTYTYEYDSETEHRGLVTKETTGVGGDLPDTIAVNYGVNGSPSQVNYPNGVTAQYAYNTVGAVTAKDYRTSADELLASWSQQYTPFGQVDNETGPQGPMSYGYDVLGRLTKVSDSRNGSCTVRTYTLNNNGNRTGKTSDTNNTTTCPTGKGSTSTTWANTFDDADRQAVSRVTGSGAGGGVYSYDSLGRTTSIPDVDTTNRTSTTVSYYADDTVYSYTQGTTSKTWSLDPMGRTSTTTAMTGSAITTITTNHYAGSGDSPAWVSMNDGSTQRFITGPGGALAFTETTTAQSVTTAELALINLHGDVVATIPDEENVPASKRSQLSATDEYGVPLANTPTTSPYQWVGAAMRDNDTLGGMIQMGARDYNPLTGRFLTTDPTPGGNPNAYTYPLDPVNMYDLNGNWGFGSFFNAVANLVTTVVRAVVAAVSYVAYRAYSWGRSAARTAWRGATRVYRTVKRIVGKKPRKTVIRPETSIISATTIGSWGDINWGKALAGVGGILEGADAVAAGVGLIAHGALVGSIYEDKGAAEAALGGAVIAYGSALTIQSGNLTVQGFTEGCPHNDCSFFSQSQEFVEQSWNNLTPGKGKAPFW